MNCSAVEVKSSVKWKYSSRVQYSTCISYLSESVTLLLLS